MFHNKIVAVINKKLESGQAMNALGHLALGLGAGILGKDVAKLGNYKDADGNDHENISERPFIVLRANSNQIRNTRRAALENNIQYVDFNHAMMPDDVKEQYELSAKTKEEELEYYGIILFGEWDKVTQFTKKFSLWK